MKNLTIILDLDSTVCDSLPAWLEAIGKRTGVYAKVSDITGWNMHQCPPLNTLDPKAVYGFLDEPGFNLGLPVMAGAQDAVAKLTNEGHRLYFVTARFGKHGMPETIEWMARHFPAVNLKAQLGFFADKHLIEADVIVDDRAETLEKYWLSHPYSTCIGIGYPYNERLIDFDRRPDLDEAGQPKQVSPGPQYRLVPYGPDAWSKIVKIITKVAKTDDDLRAGYSEAELSGLGH